jgi:hypothetical protein
MKVNFGSVAMGPVLPVLGVLLAFTFPTTSAFQTTSNVNQDTDNRLLLPTLEREENKRSQPASRPSTQLQIDQIKEDFRKLQLLNNQVRESAKLHGPLDKGLIDTLGEIRKRATRLKTNLALGKVAIDNGSTDSELDGDLNSLLGKLDQNVLSFVRNPMFRSSRVIDVGLAKTARVDIERVIALTRVIANRIRKETK